MSLNKENAKFIKKKEIQEKNKDRITVLTSSELKNKWQEFVIKNELSTLSQLIRLAVNFYIETKPKISYLNDIPNLAYGLKKPLTSIKGFSQLLLDNHSKDLDSKISLQIKEIYSNSQELEDKINELISVINPTEAPETYDILIIDNDVGSITVLKEYFEFKGFKCKGITTGVKGIKELERNLPKLILSSIMLPDITGYDVCSKIKANKVYLNIPFYYITVVPESEVNKRLNDTKADGYFIKPFNFAKFELILNQLKKKG